MIGRWDSQQACAKLKGRCLCLEESSLDEHEKPLVRGFLVILLLLLGPVVLYLPIRELLNYLPDGGLADLLKAYPILSLLCAAFLLLRWLMKALD
jgi:hypothetical protein